MTTSIWWVRHGPTHSKAAIGWTDLPADLSDVAALSRLSAHLPTDAQVISSDLQRASATADAITGARGRLPHNVSLREMNFGDWDGLEFPEISRRDPVLGRQFWQEPGDIAPPNGESWNALRGRVDTSVDEILIGKPRDIIIVAHFAVILTALQRASGISSKSVFSFKIDNLSVTRLDYLHEADAWRVQGVNHLP